jgi:hypothetical protein
MRLYSQSLAAFGVLKCWLTLHVGTLRFVCVLAVVLANDMYAQAKIAAPILNGE